MRSDPERLAVLEHRMDDRDKHLAKMEAKIDDIHNILMKAAGVRWVVVGAITITAAISAAAYYLLMLIHPKS